MTILLIISLLFNLWFAFEIVCAKLHHHFWFAWTYTGAMRYIVGFHLWHNGPDIWHSRMMFEVRFPNYKRDKARDMERWRKNGYVIPDREGLFHYLLNSCTREKE